jgi:hypothetical protein
VFIFSSGFPFLAGSPCAGLNEKVGRLEDWHSSGSLEAMVVGLRSSHLKVKSIKLFQECS